MRSFPSLNFRASGLGASLFVIGLALSGCGGSGADAGPTYNLTPNQAIRAASLGSFKSASTGSAFTYHLVRLAAPAGSPIHIARPQRSPLTQDPITGLYESNAVLGSDGAYTVQFFVDAAGTNAAGSMNFKPPTGFPNYATYPVIVPITINVTKGPVPCTGAGTITFGGATGSNHLVGDLHLTKDVIDYHFDMNLSSSLNVTGSITIKENGQEVDATNLNGSALGSIACNVLIKPTNWTGTGSLNLANGRIKVNLNTTPNLSSSDFDGSGNMVINNPDGTHSTVTNPIDANLTDTSGGGGGGGGGGTGNFLEPVAINGPTGFGIVRVLSNGNMTGYDAAGNGLFWYSTTSTPLTLKQRVSGLKVSAQGLAIVGGTRNEVVGFETNGNVTKPIIWKDVTQAPTLLPVTTSGKAFGINASGMVVGIADGKPVVWDSNGTAAAQPLKTGAYTISRATHIANNGVIADIEVGIAPYTWATATSDPIVQASVTGQPFDTVTQASDMNVVNAGMAGRGTNPSGFPVGIGFKYSSGSYIVNQLNQLPTVNNGGGAAFGISDTGILMGYASTDAGQVGVYWKDGPFAAPTDVNTKLPNTTTWKVVDIGWMLADGTLIGFGNQTGGPTNAAIRIQPSP